MDKQTAIDLLDNLLGMVEDNHDSDYDAALHMGIDALKSNAPNALDCVERQAVINEMKDMYTAAEEWAQGAHDDDTRARAESCMATNVELKLRVEKLPSVQPQRWIPVTERLPEYGMDVLTINKDDEYEINHIIDEDDGDDGEWFWHGAIAWMPLPEPYKGGQDE